MRVSTANTYDVGVAALQRRQGEMAEAQVRLTTGKRVVNASDDPVGAARAERALQGEARVTASERSVQAAQTIMVQTEASLGDAGELMQQVREALVAAGNGTYTAQERAGQAEKLKQMRDQLFTIANRTDGAGTYLFGGQGSSAPPFVDTRPDASAPPEQTGARYIGNRGNSTTDPSTSLPLALDGAAVWTGARTGNGVFETRALTAGQGGWIGSGQVTDPAALTGDSYRLVYDAAANAFDVTNTTTGAAVASVPYKSGGAIAFDGMTMAVQGTPVAGETYEVVPSTPALNAFGVLDKAIADLSSGAGGAALSQSIGDNLRNVDAVMSRLQGARSTAGEALSRIDNESASLATRKLNHQVERANAEDLDMVKAISDFQNKQSGYDAALKSYSMVQRMSLFQYVNT
ncbi:flagellar hook-associated protein FlgL [Piscinibacter sakaiensis]|uniref:Flagellar hook-associated protein FlgL n=1 Tax=Piscinibacter sakaiensis TaxID=1547922 RepID=A0A0K8NUY3_PISS1|nr:flagellar hook-associated protein FlgL [Piscinibacter sakaiensis]GAP33760.1 flagellar hook-associated protein FlgL [Piscinibacter sakaiensis]